MLYLFTVMSVECYAVRQRYSSKMDRVTLSDVTIM